MVTLVVGDALVQPQREAERGAERAARPARELLAAMRVMVHEVDVPEAERFVEQSLLWQQCCNTHTQTVSCSSHMVGAVYALRDGRCVGLEGLAHPPPHTTIGE